jgi:hypothetical protein
MIEHIVLFKLKPTTSSKDISELSKQLADLRFKIPGISKFQWGDNVSPENKQKGFMHGFIMTFPDEKARDNYLPHANHQEVVKRYIDPFVEDVLVFDINTDSF